MEIPDELTKFEEVFCLRGNDIMNYLHLDDIKTLRLINNFINDEVEIYLRETRSIGMIISQRNHHCCWRAQPQIKFKTESLRIRWRYGYDTYVTIPNQFLNISKLILILDVGAEFQTFDSLFAQLPNLQYFGFLLSLQTFNSQLWNTLNSYSNLQTLEVSSTYKYIRHFDNSPICNFLQRHPNIKTLRINLSLLTILWESLVNRHLSFQNLFIHWDDYFLNISSESIDGYFTRWHNRNLYKKLYLEFACNSFVKKIANEYLHNCRSIPGIEKITYLKHESVEYDDESVLNNENNQIIVKVCSKSEWFNFIGFE